MKKIITTIATLFICLGVVVGCGKDAVQDDLINYSNNQIPTLVDISTKVSNEYAASTGTNFVDDDTTAAKLKDVVIPTSDELLAKVKAIVPATEEVKKVHSKYIASVTETNEAFKLALKVAQNHDESLVDSVNKKLADADSVAKEYLKDLESLKKEHNVVDKK